MILIFHLHFSFLFFYDLAPSDAPSNLTAMAINSTSVHLRWLPPDDDQHNGDIRHYNIRIVELHTGREFQLNSTNDTSIYTGLHPAYSYSFTIAAVTVEIGPYSNSVIATMPEDGTYAKHLWQFNLHLQL